MLIPVSRKDCVYCHCYDTAAHYSSTIILYSTPVSVRGKKCRNILTSASSNTAPAVASSVREYHGQTIRPL